MFHLKELKNRFRMRVRDYNRIVAFLNNFCEGWGIKISRPDDPSPNTPVVISLDPDVIDAFASELPENPQTYISITPNFPGTATALSNTFTVDGTNGLKFSRLTRTVWDGTILYGFTRTETYDKFGRLYSVSGETRHVIDTAVTYNP